MVIRISAMRSPMSTLGACVLPVLISGAIDAPAMRRLAMPFTRR